MRIAARRRPTNERVQHQSGFTYCNSHVGRDLGTFNPATISSAIQASISTLLTNYTSVGLGSVGLPPGISASFSGPITGTFDSLDHSHVRLHRYLYGTAAGTYDFSVAGLVMGGRSPVKQITLWSVGSVPSPSHLLG